MSNKPANTHSGSAKKCMVQVTLDTDQAVPLAVWITQPCDKLRAVGMLQMAATQLTLGQPDGILRVNPEAWPEHPAPPMPGQAAPSNLAPEGDIGQLVIGDEKDVDAALKQRASEVPPGVLKNAT